MIKVVVPVSGGKDSQACLKLALSQYPAEEILGLFCDTKFEHPLTYEHIKNIEQWYGIRILTLNAGSVPEQVQKHKRFPTGNARFCTEELKIWPSKRYYAKLATEQKTGFEVWYGMRSDESPERGRRYAGKVGDEVYAPHEFMRKYPKRLAALGVMFRLPIVDWTYLDVMEYINGERNPLYEQGFDRVGCFPCLIGGDKAKEKAFRHDEFGAQQYATVQQLGNEIGKVIWTSKSGKVRNCGQTEKDGPGCAFCSI